MSDRYARQIALPAIGADGQARLGAARTLVIGAGGLGSYVLLILAGAGIGSLVIVDSDRVELSNLHRQPLFRTSDIGMPKAEAAVRALAAYNGEISLESRFETLTPATAMALVAPMDIVVDAADSLAVTYILSDACQALGRPLVTASVLEQHGYVGAFSGGAPSYRAVFPDMPSTVGSCEVNGVFGSAVGVLGALQAHIALQIVLRHDPSPLGRLVSVDLNNLSFGGFSFLGAPEPAGPDLSFLALSDLEPDDFVIELRDSVEAPLPAWPAAHRLTATDIAAQALPRDQRLVLCCRSGVRAFKAARTLRARGYDRLAVLAATMC